MKRHLIFPILFLLLVGPMYSQVPRRNEESDSKIRLGTDAPDRVLIVKRTYTKKKYRFRERQYVWLEYRNLDGAIISIDGTLTGIKESSIVVDVEEIPLESIARFEVQRKGRLALIYGGLLFGVVAAGRLARDEPDALTAVYGALSIGMVVTGFSLRNKVPIGDRFRISTEWTAGRLMSTNID